MEEKVLQNIMEHGLIRENDNILVGVSGGPDSMALLYLLTKVKAKISFNLIIAHVNHGVRGKEALRDQLFVKRKAEELAIPHFSIDVNMVEYGKEKGISSEEAGRELRYGFFKEILNRFGGGKIAVAHNLNDQAETLMMRLLRGTGIDGLKGMDFAAGDIIRPILNISRQEIEQYIDLNKIETVLDKTNLESIYTRNKIRLELLPYIKEHFNPNIIESLWRLSRTSKLDSEFLEAYSQKQFKYLLINKNKDYIIFNAANLLGEDIAIQQRIIRIALGEILGNLQGFTLEHISMVIDLLASGHTGKRVHLPSHIVAEISYDELIIKRKEKNSIGGNFSHKLTMGKNAFIDLGCSFDLTLISLEEMASIKKHKHLAFFDYSKLKGTIAVRNRKPGDKFIPFGMSGSKKIKDFFIDEKIPREEREKIPILHDDEDIIWVLGYRTSEIHKVTSNTNEVLMIEYILI